MDCICVHIKALYMRYKYRNQYNKNYDHIDTIDHDGEINNLIDHPYDSDIELIKNDDYISSTTPDKYIDTTHPDNLVNSDRLLSLDEYHTDSDGGLSDDLYSCSSGENSPIDNRVLDNSVLDNSVLDNSVFDNSDGNTRYFIESMINDLENHQTN
jgi:hypothetical protein